MTSNSQLLRGVSAQGWRSDCQRNGVVRIGHWYKLDCSDFGLIDLMAWSPCGKKLVVFGKNGKGRLYTQESSASSFSLAKESDFNISPSSFRQQVSSGGQEITVYNKLISTSVAH